MGTIKNFIEKIKSARYGKDVRQSIVDAIEQTYSDAISNGHTDMEVAKARDTYNDLNSRLEADKNKMEAKLTNEEDDRKRTLEDIQKQVNGLAREGHLVASNVSEMTDTNRTYINTEDGHWYYYNGSWKDGGVYQATEIEDKSLTLYKLDDDLRENFISSYENVNLDAENVQDGYIKMIDNTMIVDTSMTGYKYTYKDLFMNKIYNFQGYNDSRAVGLIVVDTDDSNKIVYSTRNQSAIADNIKPVNLYFKPNKNNLRAYIQISANYWSTIMKESVMLLRLNNVNLNVKNTNELLPIKNVDGYFVKCSVSLNNRPELTSNKSGNFNIYKMIKGVNYTIKSANLYLISGITLTNENFESIYYSSSGNQSSKEIVNYEFTANTDGYILLTNYGVGDGDYSFKSEIKIKNEFEILNEKIKSKFEILNEEISNQKTKNILYGKKWIACGDSFTAGDFSGATDPDGKTGTNSTYFYDNDLQMYKTYPWWIAKRNNMIIINEARSGSILALDKTYIADSTNISINTRQPFSYKRYKEVPTDADYITIAFGLNDCLNTNLGTINDTTNETFYGALNVVLEYLLTNCTKAKIGIIIMNAWMPLNYANAMKEVATRWGVSYLDLMYNNNINTYMTKDGLCDKAKQIIKNRYNVSSSNGHPNVLAHEMKSTIIEKYLRSL